MLKALHSHIKRVLNPSWTECVQDTTPAHGNKSVSIQKVCQQLFWGILCNRTTLRDIETQTEIVGERIADTTMNDVLKRLSPGTLPELIARQIKKACADKELAPVKLPFHMVAIDGKNLYTSRARTDKEGNTNRHSHMALRAALVSASCVQILGQRKIPKKSAETTELPAFLDHLEELYGRTNLLELISVDAGMTHLKNANYLNEKGMMYLMALKENQPGICRVAEKLTYKHAAGATTTTHHSGNEVSREISIATLQGNLSKWTHATEIWKVTQTSTHAVSGKTITETRLFITNMPKGKASASQKLEAVRRHWRVENDAFWTMDAIFQEDTFPYCSEAIELVGLLRIMAFNLAARFRARRLRSKANRQLRWRDFIQYYQALYHCLYIPREQPT